MYVCVSQSGIRFFSFHLFFFQWTIADRGWMLFFFFFLLHLGAIVLVVHSLNTMHCTHHFDAQNGDAGCKIEEEKHMSVGEKQQLHSCYVQTKLIKAKSLEIKIEHHFSFLFIFSSFAFLSSIYNVLHFPTRSDKVERLLIHIYSVCCCNFVLLRTSSHHIWSEKWTRQIAPVLNPIHIILLSKNKK